MPPLPEAVIEDVSEKASDAQINYREDKVHRPSVVRLHATCAQNEPTTSNSTTAKRGENHGGAKADTQTKKWGTPPSRFQIPPAPMRVRRTVFVLFGELNEPHWVVFPWRFGDFYPLSHANLQKTKVRDKWNTLNDMPI